MKQIVQNYKTGKLSVEDVPMPKVKPGGVLVKNAFSLISAGTERSSVELASKSLLGKAKSRPEDFKKVIRLAKKQGILNAYKTAMDRLEIPVPLGYSSSGIVMEVGKGVKDIKVGDRVACAGAGYASHAEVIFVPKNLCALIPKNVPLDWAAFTTLGSIAMQGIRQADIRVGENVAVIGLGLLGQLTVQILKASGCRVVGLDIADWKVDLAKSLGADLTFNARISDFGFRISDFTNGIGVDAVIITAASSSNDPFLLAPEIARDRAKIVLVGVARLDFPREPYYRKELSLVLARSYGPGRYDTKYEEEGIDYPVGYVRWTEKRNLESILNLMAENKLNIASLVSHRFKIEDAQKAYNLILGKTKEKFLGILFEYDTEKEHETKITITDTPLHRYPDTQINVGFIGAGNFARTYLLPNIKGKKTNLVGVADAQSTIAKMIAQKYAYKYCTSDYHKLLDDKTITTIFIATRHNLHAQLIIESLKAGKNIFCEKPLCLDKKELKEIITTYNQINKLSEKANPPSSPFFKGGKRGILMIGFNRRFAPLTLEAKRFMTDKIGPYLINCRINAGMLPSDHWLLDLKQGGGRIVGEVCHFIDLISYFTQARLVSVYAQALSGSKTVANDNIITTLKYEDGSVGLISYFAVGDKDFPKERIEIFGDEKVCVIDDFTELVFSTAGKQTKTKKSQDKGYRNEISAFFDAIATGNVSPIPFSQIVETTLATFAINESLHSGKAVNIPKIDSK